MPYYVIGPDGQKYGPVEPQQLQVWVMEGRITPQTFIEDVTSGARVPAGALPYLTNPAPVAVAHPPSATPAFPPPVVEGGALVASGLRAAIPANAKMPVGRRRRPWVAVLRICAAIFMMNVFVKRMAAGHTVVRHTASSDYYWEWLDKYPAINLAIIALLIYWAWRAWRGTEYSR